MIILIAGLAASRKLVKSLAFISHGTTYPIRPEGQENFLINQIGLRQNFLLGKQFRQKYRQFISPAYNHTQVSSVYVQGSSNELALQAFLFGLYPLGSGPRLQVNISELLDPPGYQKQSTGKLNKVEVGDFALSRGYTPIASVKSQLLQNCPNFQKKFEQIENSLKQQAFQIKLPHLPVLSKLGRAQNQLWQHVNTQMKIKAANGWQYKDQLNQRQLEVLARVSMWEEVNFYSTDLGKALVNQFVGQVARFLEGPAKTEFIACLNENILYLLTYQQIVQKQCILDDTCFMDVPFSSSLQYLLFQGEDGGRSLDILFNGRLVKTVGLREWLSQQQQRGDTSEQCS